MVLAAGVGEAGKLDLESLRRAAGAAVRAASGVKTIALALPASTDEQVRAVVEGALLGGYIYDRYLGKKADRVAEIVVLTERARTKSAGEAAAAAQIVAEAVNFTRDLVNTPPNDLYPQSFAEELQARAKSPASRRSPSRSSTRRP